MRDPRAAAAQRARADCDGARATAASGTPASRTLGVPILAGDAAIGVISVQSTRPRGRVRRGRRRGLLPTIAANVGVAIQNARLVRGDAAAGRRDGGAGRRRPPRSRRRSTSAAVLERDGRARTVAARRRHQRRVPREPDGQTFRAIVGPGHHRGRDPRRHDHPMGEGIIGDAAAAGRAEFVNDVATGPARRSTSPAPSDDVEDRLMVAPLIARDSVDRRDGRLALGPSPARSPTADLASSSASPSRRRSRSRTPASSPRRRAARRRRRGGQPGQEHVPGRDEPRDPDADERDHRHERPAARHAARRRAARLRRDDPDLRRRAADDHQRHPRLLEDRGRQGRAGARAVRAPAVRSRARSTCWPGRPRPRASSSLYAVDDDLPTGVVGDAGRLRQIVLNLLSNARQVHRRAARSSCGSAANAVERRRGGDRRPLGDHGRRPRHRHRHPARAHGPAVPVVQPGRRVDLATLRRDGPRPGDQPPPGRADGRLADAESSGVAGEGARSTCRSTADEATGSRAGHTPEPAPRPAPAARVLVVDDNATNRRILVAQLGRWEMTPRDTASPTRGARLDRGGRAVRPRDPRLPHAGDGRRRAGRADPRRRRDGGPPMPIVHPVLGRRPRAREPASPPS